MRDLPRTLIVLALMAVVAVPALSQSVAFSQLSLDLDDGLTLYSDWGSVELTYTGSADVLYFNLAVDGTWQVQNVAVLSDEGYGVLQSISFDFDLGVPVGTPLDSLSCAFILTTATEPAMPTGEQMAPVSDEWVIMSAGLGTGIYYVPAEPLIGGEVDPGRFDRPTNDGIGNQECGKAECVPAAVSNSLKWLNTKHSLGIPADELTTAKMKTATGWSNGCDYDFPTTKDNYMKNKRFRVSTTTTVDPAVAVAKVSANCDVELVSTTHCAVVTGIVKNANGTYKITVKHDTEQGEAGGLKTETVIYNPATGKLSGGKWFSGNAFKYFVIECPKPVGGNPKVRGFIDFYPPDYQHELFPTPYTSYDAYVYFDCLDDGLTAVSFRLTDIMSACEGVFLSPSFESLLPGGQMIGDPFTTGVTLTSTECVGEGPEGYARAAVLHFFYLSGECCIELLDHLDYPRWVVDCDDPGGVDYYCVLSHGSVDGGYCPDGEICECEQPAAVKDTSWGSIKALYR